MGPKSVPNRIFDAEALRKPLGGLLERSWKLLEPKKRSFGSLLAALGGFLGSYNNLLDPGNSPRGGNPTGPGEWGEEPGGGEQASRSGSLSSSTADWIPLLQDCKESRLGSHWLQDCWTEERTMLHSRMPLASRGRRICMLALPAYT